jgi:hypothetical protein
MALRDVIYESQLKYDFGVLENDLNHWRRQEIYKEIMQFSYMEYFHAFVLPYYQYLHPQKISYQEILATSDLRRFERALVANPRVSIFQNKNDFLLKKEDSEWLQRNFDAHRLHFFDKGGHLGGLYIRDVRERVLQSLDGLGAQQ